LCAGGYEAGDGVGVGSTSGALPDHLPMGASTIQCIELQKNNKTSSITKSYVHLQYGDNGFEIVCMMCNINNLRLCYNYVTSSLFNLQLYFEFTNEIISFQNYI
jgi:hypothetical protein